MINSRDINLLRSDVAANCRIFLELCKAEGLNVLVTGTVRDEEYQRQCYQNGTAGTPYPSFHATHAGLAFDICKNVKGQEYSDLSFFKRCGEIGKKMGFEWGGDWKSFPDRPHFQWSQGGKFTSAMIRAKKYPPTMPLYKEEEIEMTREDVLKLMDERLPVYKDLEDMPEWARPAIQRMIGRGALQGDAEGHLNLSFDFMRTLVVLDRLEG
jgi:hypothetical protein